MSGLRRAIKKDDIHIAIVWLVVGGAGLGLYQIPEWLGGIGLGLGTAILLLGIIESLLSASTPTDRKDT